MLARIANLTDEELKNIYTKKQDKKYYIEITYWDNIGKKNEVIMSSELFDTMEECFNWANKVKKLANNYSINLFTIDIYNNKKIDYILKGE